jgi:tetratricopeptide (TPR) repeat protein
MSIESLLITIVILLVLILVTHIFSLLNQVSWVKAASELLAEQEKQSKSKHSDIGDLIKKKEYKEAIMKIDQRVKTVGEDGALLWYKGMALYNLERWEESDAAIKKAIEMEPSYKNDLQPYLDVLSTRL